MLKVAVVILVVMLAYATVYSLMILILPELMLKSNLSAQDKTVDAVRTEGYLNIIVTSQRGAGVFALATTISGFFVLFAGFRKAEKWAWLAFLFVGGLAWCGGLVINIMIGNTTDMVFQIIGTVMLLVGLLISFRAFFAAASEEPEEAVEEA